MSDGNQGPLGRFKVWFVTPQSGDGSLRLFGPFVFGLLVVVGLAIWATHR